MSNESMKLIDMALIDTEPAIDRLEGLDDIIMNLSASELDVTRASLTLIHMDLHNALMILREAWESVHELCVNERAKEERAARAAVMPTLAAAGGADEHE